MIVYFSQIHEVGSFSEIRSESLDWKDHVKPLTTSDRINFAILEAQGERKETHISLK